VPTALTRIPAPTLGQCQLTHLQRQPIAYERALEQHHGYCETLRAAGMEVISLPEEPALPDSVFIEDCAIILDELAIITSMGTPTRHAEPQSIVPTLARWHPLASISWPATLEGGDVLRVGKTLYVGLSSRTNSAGIAALREIVRPYGYQVVAVSLHGCLHLKTACTALDQQTLLLNPTWLDPTPLRSCRLVPVPPDEPWAANVLLADGLLCMNAAFPQTLALAEQLGYAAHAIDISEFLKAEAGLTCLSLLLDD
jgi:dimethylargininase